MKIQNNPGHDLELKTIIQFFNHKVSKYIFMVVDDQRILGYLIANIQIRLKKKKIEILEMPLSDTDAYVYRQVKDFLKENECDGLIVTELNPVIYKYADECIDLLNKSRDAFERFPLPIVFVVNNDNLTKIINGASDFYQLRDLPDFHFKGKEIMAGTDVFDIELPSPDSYLDAELKTELLEKQLQSMKKNQENDKTIINTIVVPLLTIYIDRECFKKMNRLFQHYIKDREHLIDNKPVLASYYYKTYDLENCIASSNRALEHYKDSNNRIEMARCYYQLGKCYYRMENYKKALKYNQSSLAINEELMDNQGISYNFFQMGRIYQGMGNYDKAIMHYEKGLKLVEKIDDPVTAACYFGQIGTIYQERGKYEDALIEYQKALGLAQKAKSISRTANNWARIGTLYLAKHQYPISLESFFKAFELLSKLGSPNAEIVRRYIQMVREKISKEQLNKILKEFNFTLDGLGL